MSAQDGDLDTEDEMRLLLADTGIDLGAEPAPGAQARARHAPSATLVNFDALLDDVDADLSNGEMSAVLAAMLILDEAQHAPASSPAVLHGQAPAAALEESRHNAAVEASLKRTASKAALWQLNTRALLEPPPAPLADERPQSRAAGLARLRRQLVPRARRASVDLQPPALPLETPHVGAGGALWTAADARARALAVKEHCLAVWLEALLGAPAAHALVSHDLFRALHDGVVLVRLAQLAAAHLLPSDVPAQLQPRSRVQRQTNILCFLHFCLALGLPASRLFRLEHLYFGDDMPRVLAVLALLGHALAQLGLRPHLRLAEGEDVLLPPGAIARAHGMLARAAETARRVQLRRAQQQHQHQHQQETQSHAAGPAQHAAMGGAEHVLGDADSAHEAHEARALDLSARQAPAAPPADAEALVDVLLQDATEAVADEDDTAAAEPDLFVDDAEALRALPAAVALHDFSPSYDAQLGLTAGDELHVLEAQEGADWVKVLRGHDVGLVPRSYVALRQAGVPAQAQASLATPPHAEAAPARPAPAPMPAGGALTRAWLEQQLAAQGFCHRVERDPDLLALLGLRAPAPRPSPSGVTDQ